MGTTLFVSGMAKSPVRGEGNSSCFRSGSSIGDAHIKNLSSRITPGPYAAAPTISPRGGTAAFRSTSPSDRDSHIKDISSRFNSSGFGNSPSGAHGNQLPTASYRSGSPIACAHILAMTKPTDASYNSKGAFPYSGTQNSASYRSHTTIADAHIKALPKFHESVLGVEDGSMLTARSCTSPFKSHSSIADAHIKAVPKPVDLLLAYQETQ